MDLSFLNNQGMGWAVVSLLIPALVYLFHLLLAEKDKRAQDGKDYMAATLGPLRDLTNAVGSLQKQEELNSDILRNLKK